MSEYKNKLGPIPDDHFENETAPRRDVGRAYSKEANDKFAEGTKRAQEAAARARGERK